MTARAAWPSGNREASPPDDDSAGVRVPSAQALPDQGPALAVIGDMAALLRDTRCDLLTSGCMLAAIMIGLALEAGLSAHALRASVAGVLNLAMLCGLLVSWLIAFLVLAWASKPVLSTLSELRWVTGAPLDPRAPWLTLPPPGVDAGEWTWFRAHLLLGAARLARHRMRLADTWTYLTAGCFLIWTAAIILGV